MWYLKPSNSKRTPVCAASFNRPVVNALSRVPRHGQEKLTQTLIVRLLTMRLFLLFQILVGLGPPWPPPPVHMGKRTSFKNLLSVCLKENEIIFHEIYEDLPDEFSHVHARDHLLKDLLARVDRHFIHSPVPLGYHKIKLAVVSKCSPLGVDDLPKKLSCL